MFIKLRTSSENCSASGLLVRHRHQLLLELRWNLEPAVSLAEIRLPHVFLCFLCVFRLENTFLQSKQPNNVNQLVHIKNRVANKKSNNDNRIDPAPLLPVSKVKSKMREKDHTREQKKEEPSFKTRFGMVTCDFSDPLSLLISLYGEQIYGILPILPHLQILKTDFKKEGSKPSCGLVIA